MRLSLKTLQDLFKGAESEADKLPKLISRAEKAAASIHMGSNKQRRAAPGEDFWQFREYTPGDRPQDIDWRQTAKTDTVFIKERELQTNQNFYIWCQSSPSMAYSSLRGLDSKLDNARILCFAAAIILQKSGQKIRFSQSEKMQDFESFAHDLYYQQTAALPNHIRPSLKNAALILVGDFLSPLEDIAHTLKPYKQSFSDVYVIQTLDPAELELPFKGRMIFDALGYDTSSEQLDDIDSIRPLYQERITVHNKALRDFCHDKEWHYIAHKTNEGFDNALSSLWRILHGEKHSTKTQHLSGRRSAT